MRPGFAQICLLAAVLFSLLMMRASDAYALPAFAAQTGQPCQTCHVGGFGPQLTPFGRNFKLGGYTLRKTKFNVPLSAMAVTSFVHTNSAQAEPPAPHFKTNDNVAIDEISLFLAGGLGQHLGGFLQVTYNGIEKAWAWDNVDVRAVTTTKIKGADVTFGLSLNNSPTTQDAWNTLPAWGFPYTESDLAPSPGTAPLLSGTLAQTSLGLTAYAWINGSVFIEGGGYASPGARLLHHLGVDPNDPGDIHGLAPYGRIAAQKDLAGGTLEVGAFGMRANLHPGRDRSTGFTDRYTDLGLDASFQKALKSGDVISFNGRYIRERQGLRATCALAEAPDSCVRNKLSEARADASYYWRNKVGLTVGAFDISGSANPVIFAHNRTFKPDSSGLMFQLDYTPFGDRSQPQRRINLRVGLQYTLYTRFDGARSDFDNTGRRASDQNTLRIFAWFAF
jgi:hypothetical protein